MVNGAFALLNGALQFLNTGFGQVVAQATLFGGAIFGLGAKLKAMNIITVVAGQFSNLGLMIKNAAFAASGMQGPLLATTGIMGSMLPIIMGTVAAVALLAKGIKAYKESRDVDLQLSNLKDINSEYETQKERIKELEALGGDLTSAEREELETLRQQTEELEKQKQIQAEKTADAIQAEFQSKVMGTRVGVEKTEGSEFGILNSSEYNKVEEAFDNLISMAQQGQQGTREYKSELKGFISEWGELADSWEEAAEAGVSLNEEQTKVVEAVKLARGELKYINKEYPELIDSTEEATERLQEYSDAYKSLEDRLTESTAALKKFKQATAVDYSAPLKDYQTQWKTLIEKIQSGTANFADIQAGVELFLPEGTLESLNYDLEAAMELLGEHLSGILSTVFGASDPLAGFRQVLEEAGGQLTLGDEVVAQIVGDNGVMISSYEKLAEYMGIPVELAQAFGGAIQQISPTLFYTQGEIDNLTNALKELGNTGDNLSPDKIIQTISQITGATDPARIQGFYQTLQSIGVLDPDINISTGDIEKALNETEDLAGKVKDLPDKKDVNITTKITDGGLSSYASMLNGLSDHSVNVSTTISIKDSLGNVISAGQAQAILGGGGTAPVVPWLAKGTDYAAGGDTLVNDGAPINGSAAELIVEDGNARIVNGGLPTITNLEKGAKVYTAAETQAILKNSQGNGSGLLGDGIQAFYNGTIGRLPSVGSTPSNYNPSASGTITPTTSNAADRKKEFDEWLKEKKHYLAMDMITEAEYYRDLEIMNERYLKDQKDYLDEYWQHQEEIYQYQKRDLEDIVKLEEKLNNLAKAKTQKILVYKDGMFQYMQNTEAIAKAQRAVSGYANGTTHATAGVHMVGEHGAELRVLGEGDGIIPADITKNLMKIGSMGVNGLNKSNGGETNYYNIQNVKLEKVDDVDSFFTGLKSLALQSSTART